MGRSDLSRTLICLQLPDDTTGALPLLRSVILNDPKASTYKLALLRVIARVADSTAGLAVSVGDDRVRIPLGVVGLFWVRMFKPLLASRFPQARRTAGSTRSASCAKTFASYSTCRHRICGLARASGAMTRGPCAMRWPTTPGPSSGCPRTSRPTPMGGRSFRPGRPGVRGQPIG
jgi:hypothetical protein